MTLRQIAIKYGLILGGGLTTYGIIYRLARLERLPGLTWIFYLMVPVAVFFALRALRDSGKGPLRFAHGIGLGSLVSAAGSSIYAVYVYLYNHLIDDSLLVGIRDGYREQFEAQGLAGDELAQAMAPIITSTQPSLFSLQVGIMLTLAGMVGALLIAAVLRRRPSVRTAAHSYTKRLARTPREHVTPSTGSNHARPDGP